MRVVLDTNVVVSAFLSPTGTPAQILARWENQAFDLVASKPLLLEYQRALNYHRVAARHGMSPEEVEEIVEGFREFALLVEPAETLELPGDPDDAKVLECAVEGSAEYVVSGDAHLLRLHGYRGIMVLSPAVFLSALVQGESIG